MEKVKTTRTWSKYFKTYKDIAMGYAVGDKVEFSDFSGMIRSAYLIRISTCKYRTKTGPLWELRFTKVGHEFYRYESDIISKISSNFEGYNNGTD